MSNLDADGFDNSEVDWKKVNRNMVDALKSLRAAEAEIASGFDSDADDLTVIMMDAENITVDLKELTQGLTNSRSYLDNGTLNYLPR